MEQKHVAPISKLFFKQEAVVSVALASGRRRSVTAAAPSPTIISSFLLTQPSCVCSVFGNVTYVIQVEDTRTSAVCSGMRYVSAAADKSCSPLSPICFALTKECSRNGPRVSFFLGVSRTPRFEVEKKKIILENAPLHVC